MGFLVIVKKKINAPTLSREKIVATNLLKVVTIKSGSQRLKKDTLPFC